MTAEAPAQTERRSSPATLPRTLRRVVLTGFMGAGKSAVGRMLADELGWRFLDLDAHVESRCGATIPELFAQHGEPRFRRLESSALANALKETDTVLALGGGTPELVGNRLLLEQTPGTATVFLHAPFSTLYDRCMLQSIGCPDHIRPVLSTPQEAERRFRLREPIYRRISRVTVDTSLLATGQVVGEILRTLAA